MKFLCIIGTKIRTKIFKFDIGHITNYMGKYNLNKSFPLSSFFKFCPKYLVRKIKKPRKVKKSCCLRI